MLRKSIREFLLSAGDKTDVPCRVPASLYSVFSENGFIPDPYYSENIRDAADGMPDECVFRATIEVTEAEARYKHIYLELSGLDLLGEIIFNGKTYAKAQSPNRVHILEVTDRIRAGENLLEIIAESKRSRKRLLNSDGSYSNDYATAPYLPDIGILAAPRLIATNSAIISEVRVTQAHENNKVTLMVDIDTLGDSEDVRAIATLTSPTGELYYGGISMGHGIITVKNPQLWWPTGLGSPDLYKLAVTLYYKGEATDFYETKIGLRSITLSSDENGVPAVVVNGVKIFSKGATYVAESSVYPNVKRENTERLIKYALLSNMNTIRTMSEEIAPPDFLLELCDKYGLLVWHDVSVHYIAPPATAAYAAGISASIRDLVARVSAHPSCALLYLTVTESEMGDRAPSPEAMREFREVSGRVLRLIIERYATNTVFVVNRDELDLYDERYATARKLGRFAYYLPSLPSPLSVEAFTSDKQENLLSPVMEAHTMVDGNVTDMLETITRELRMPKGTVQLSYASQLAAAYALRDIMKSARMDATASMSAVCRQLNDGWPSVSSSFVDWYGRRKAAMFLARDFYAPIMVYPSESEGRVSFYICNDHKKDFAGKLTYALYDTSERCIFEQTVPVLAPMMTQAFICEGDFSDSLSESSRELYYIYQLYDENGVVCDGAAPLTPCKRFSFSPEKIDFEIVGMGKSFSVKLTSRGLAAGVCVSFFDIDAEFDKNFVDMSGIDPVRLNFVTDRVTTCEELAKKIEIRSARDIG